MKWMTGWIFLVLISCSKQDGAPAAGSTTRASRKANVVVQTVAAREIEATIEAVGTLEPAQEIRIPARVSGIVDSISFREGDKVTKDSVLIEIDRLRHRLNEEHAAAEAQRAKAQVDLAELLHRQQLALQEEARKLDKTWVTEEQLAGSNAELKRTQADFERARVELELARKQHADSRVTPPIPGHINTRFVSLGEYVKPETVVATILDLSSMHLRFRLPVSEASRLSMDQELTFSVQSIPDRVFQAKLFHISGNADPQARTLECKAVVQGETEALRAGQFVPVRAVTERRTGIVIPRSAVRPTERGFVVFIVEENRARSSPVELGLNAADGVEILSGLQPDQILVVDGAAALRDGMDVSLVTEPSR